MQSEAAWGGVIFYLLAGLAAATWIYLRLGRVLEKYAVSKTGGISQIVATASPPYFAVLAVILGVNLALNSVGLPRGWLMLCKFALAGVVVFTIVKLVKKLRAANEKEKYGKIPPRIPGPPYYDNRK
ncbi:MAG: hypothetical protein C4523_16925 [Myxococcales bacterium]|nr:MAG: hypothetical protein C4523_16925 [Myxococcales bacterium]